MVKLVLLRHGESLWNKENRFTGWMDVDLSEKGVDEAKKAGLTLKNEKYSFDLAYTSVLKRATRTLDFVLDKMNVKIPITNSWRLNERHYGALQGLNKEEMAKKFGEEQVHIWRRSYDVRPPALKKTDKMYPGNDKKYEKLSKKDLPLTECLKDTVKRVMPFWEKEILPQIKKGKHILIAAHGNSLRALVKIIDNVPDKEITELNIPTGIPLVYEFDKSFKAKKHYFLGDQNKIREAMTKVAGQGKITTKK